jgi:Mg-chelatase subunit ChlI
MRLSDHSCANVINTLEGVHIMDAREELKRWIAMVVQMSAEEESKVIKQDIDLFLSVAGELSGKLADRNVALAKQIRPRSSASPAKPPKPSPQKAQNKPEPSPSSDDSPASQNPTQDRSQERSGQSQQSDAGQNDTDRSDQQIMRQQTYGQQDDEARLRQAAKRIAR